MSTKPLIMGVINITLDSFSDGGIYNSPEKALNQCEKLVADGADYLDLGAESSRPGAKKIDPETEWQRLEPILIGLETADLAVKISIDSKNSSTLLKATKYNISMLNNISGLCDPPTLQELGSIPNMEYMAMHMHKIPQTMQQDPLNSEAVVETVGKFFTNAQKNLESAGFSKSNIWLDPGIGFGKTDSANLRLLANTGSFAENHNLAIGISRKSWIGRTLDIENPKDRDNPSKLMELGLWMLGAKLIRTHDVKKLANLREVLIRDDSCGKS